MSDAVPALQCLGLSKVFRDFWLRPRAHAVKGIDLTIAKGEVLGLLGPNGSGKSTTIKMILGLLHPTAGKIAVLGRGPREVENKRRIGYLPEESYLYKYLTPRETLDFYGKLFGLSPANRRVRTDMLLEMVGLSHAADRAVGEFSKGMQRKVGLAQALINDPEFLLLDEPTSGMDPIAIHETKLVIQKLKEAGKTVLLCSHQMSEVEDVCDRVVIMYGGKIRMEGSVADLLTVQGETTLTLPALDAAGEAQVRGLLGQNGLSPLHVAHPRRSLEKLFFEVVSSARGGGADTAGATAGGKFAAFLGSGAKPGNADILSAGNGGILPPQAARVPAAKAQVVKVQAEKTQEVKAQEVPKVAPAGGTPAVPADRMSTLPAPAPSAAMPEDALLTELTTGRKPSQAPPVAAKPVPAPAADDALVDLLGDKPKAAPSAPAARKAPPASRIPSASDADDSVLKDLLG